MVIELGLSSKNPNTLMQSSHTELAGDLQLIVLWVPSEGMTHHHRGVHTHRYYCICAAFLFALVNSNVVARPKVQRGFILGHGTFKCVRKKP